MFWFIFWELEKIRELDFVWWSLIVYLFNVFSIAEKKIEVLIIFLKRV